MDHIKYNLKSALPQVLHTNKADYNIFGREPITLSVVYKKIPHGGKSIVIQLPHGLTPSTVCVFTKDAFGSDYERTSEHYKKLAKKEEVSGDVTFIALRELAVCYQTFESKRRLGATFDMFLADRRILHRLPNKLGKAFYAKRKFPYPVDLEGDLAAEIGTAMTSAQLVLRGRGSMESCPIGWMGMSEAELTSNVVAMTSAVLSKWPGGLANIRAIYVNGSEASVPVFYSLSDYSGPELSKSTPPPPTADTFQADINAVLADLPPTSSTSEPPTKVPQSKKIRRGGGGANKKESTSTRKTTSKTTASPSIKKKAAKSGGGGVKRLNKGAKKLVGKTKKKARRGRSDDLR